MREFKNIFDFLNAKEVIIDSGWDAGDYYLYRPGEEPKYLKSFSDEQYSEEREFTENLMKEYRRYDLNTLIIRNDDMFGTPKDSSFYDMVIDEIGEYIDQMGVGGPVNDIIYFK